MPSIVSPDGTETAIERGLARTDDQVDELRRRGALVMQRQGFPLRLIARHYGVSRQTIYNWTKARGLRPLG